MRFEWDEAKNRLNRGKHGLSFEVASHVFLDPLAMTILDLGSKGEQRWRTIGRIQGIVLVLIAHTTREEGGEEVFRIISARRATTNERKRYEDETR
jgi:uncharacterized DUF497 family protein